MPTYLWQASYTSEGAKGLAKEGGTKRRAAVQQMVEKAGGKLHAFYFAIGESDVYAIAEFPDVDDRGGDESRGQCQRRRPPEVHPAALARGIRRGDEAVDRVSAAGA